MKNLLREFFRSIDNFIFNYLSKAGLIKHVDPATAVAIGSKLLGGLMGRNRANQAARQRQAAVTRAFDQFRDPTEILTEGFGEQGLYGRGVQDLILGRERDLIGDFVGLQGLRAQETGDLLGDIRFQDKLTQLGDLQALSPMIRESIQDPRLAQLADADLATAERLTREAQGPLGFEARRRAEQQALGTSQALGRLGDSSSIARAILGRESARIARDQLAADARTRAVSSAQRAAVDPSRFLFGGDFAADRLRQGIFGQELGTMVTDPGAIFNIGQAEDARAAQRELGQGMMQAARTSGGGLGNLVGTLGSAFGNFLGSKNPTDSPINLFNTGGGSVETPSFGTPGNILFPNQNFGAFKN